MRILFAVLDWGLGHATRSIPLIDALIKKGTIIHIASSGSALELLKNSYPSLTFHSLPSYQVSYSQLFDQGFAVLAQLPKLLTAVREEQKLVQALHEEFHFDRIISDHRYGCNLERVPSVFLSHQLSVIPPKGFGWARSFVRKQHLKQLEVFDEIWIPDFEGKENMAGSLSQGFHLEKNHRFLGALSRFIYPDKSPTPTPFEYVGIVSGPEPHRRLFEKELIQELAKLNGRACVIRGRPDWGNEPESIEGVQVLNHLDTEIFQSYLVNAQLVISRSGYSSIMDYSVLGLKNVVLVPTPGQSEQEYLAEEAQAAGRALRMRQGQLDAMAARELVGGYRGFPLFEENRLLNSVLEEWL
ncbi:MAG: glycosyl transferase family 28 [Bacteroidia bacterium]|nr:glycosyl transferase family 28 [Bacteroidia bacterium]